MSGEMSRERGDWPVPRSAYVHVPFCRHRCGYCNFSVVAGRDDLADRFVNAIDRELSTLESPAIDTLFIGGGTPTHLAPKLLDRFLGATLKRFNLTPSDRAQPLELSIEANPEDIDEETIGILADHGVNRLSLGVQSFQADKLKVLQRGHDGKVAAEAIEMAAHRIDNVSVDLIFAAPGETPDQWQDDLQQALALPIDHLSTYALTFEKGTSFWSQRQRGILRGLNEDTEIEMYQTARQMTSEAGLGHYEISNFARLSKLGKPGKQCRHNLAYWQGRGWYACGPGAARFVDGKREVNHRSTTTYLKRIESGLSPVHESESISREQYARERFAFGVRMIDGVDMTSLSAETGLPLSKLCQEELSEMNQQGLITLDDGRVQLTERGILFADTVASELLGTPN